MTRNRCQGERTCSWWAIIELEGLTGEASRQGWDGASTQLRKWLVCSQQDLGEMKREFAKDALQETARLHLALKLLSAATAEDK